MNTNTKNSGSPSIAKGTTRTEHHKSNWKDLDFRNRGELRNVLRGDDS